MPLPHDIASAFFDSLDGPFTGEALFDEIDDTVYFLKDLVTGKRKCKDAFSVNILRADIKCDAVKVLYAPHYENLSIERILEQARKNPVINDYLPEDRDMHKVPR